MGKVSSFKVNNWIKYDNDHTTVVEDADVIGRVIKEYMNDLVDGGELQLFEECNVIAEQKIDIDDLSYASFVFRKKFTYAIEIDADNNWNKTNDSYSVQYKDQAEEYETFKSTEQEIRKKVNNGKRYEANTWELLKDNVRKVYSKWQPYKYIYNCVLEDSYFVPGTKDIYMAIVFKNEQYEARLLIREVACLGRKNMSDEDLEMAKNEDIFSDENYYFEEVFTTIFNKNTKKSVRFYDKHYHTIKDFIIIKQKSIEATVLKKRKKESKVDFDGYIDLFDDKK